MLFGLCAGHLLVWLAEYSLGMCASRIATPHSAHKKPLSYRPTTSAPRAGASLKEAASPLISAQVMATKTGSVKSVLGRQMLPESIAMLLSLKVRVFPRCHTRSPLHQSHPRGLRYAFWHFDITVSSGVMWAALLSYFRVVAKVG